MSYRLSLPSDMSIAVAPQAVLWSSAGMEDTSPSPQWLPSAEWLLPMALARYPTAWQCRIYWTSLSRACICRHLYALV